MGYDVTITRLELAGWLDLRGAPDKVAQCVSELHLTVPAQPNSLSTDGELRLLWLGPRRWLLNAPVSRETELAQLAVRFEDDDEMSAALVSDYHTGFEISGSGVREVLSQATPLDMHLETFADHSASYTEFFGLTALLFRVGADNFQVYVERSYADFTQARLLRAAG